MEKEELMSDPILESTFCISKDWPDCHHCKVPVAEGDDMIRTPSGETYHIDCFKRVWENPYQIDLHNKKITKGYGGW